MTPLRFFFSLQCFFRGDKIKEKNRIREYFDSVVWV